MKIEYVVQKILKKIFNRPCIKESRIDNTARIDVGTVISNSTLGKYSYVGEHSSMIHTKVGAFTCISNYCAIGGGTHPIKWVSMSPVFNTSGGIIKKKLGTTEFEPFSDVKIGNDVWIGSHVLVKSGVTIADGAVIGMGSVVTHDVGAYEIWAGNPARLIRKRFDETLIQDMQRISWWNLSDKQLKELAPYIENPYKFVEKFGEEK